MGTSLSFVPYSTDNIAKSKLEEERRRRRKGERIRRRGWKGGGKNFLLLSLHPYPSHVFM